MSEGPAKAESRPASTEGALLLDFGGTLDSDGVPWGARFFEAYRAAGGRLEGGAFEPLFRATDAALLEDPGTRRLGFRAMVVRQAELVRDLAREPIDAAAIAARFHRDAVAIVERNRPLLARLGRRLRLAVVSNFTGNLAVCLEELGLAPLFEAALDSAVIGVAKPDAGIFTAALDAIGVRAERAWFVGDNPYNDIAPALALGMRACWLSPAGRPAPAGIAGAARVEVLARIEEVIA